MDKISKRSFLLFGLDGIAILLSIQLAVNAIDYFELQPVLQPPFLGALFFVYPLFFYVFDLYFPFKYYRPGKTLVDIVLACACACVALPSLWFLNHSFSIPRYFFILFNVVLILATLAVRLIYDVFFQARMMDKKTLIVGTGAMAQTMAKVIQDTPHSGLELIGFASEKNSTDKVSSSLPIVGSTTELLSLIDWHHINLVILALDPSGQSSEPDLMMILMRQKVQVTSAVHLFEKLDEAIPYDCVNQYYVLALISSVRGLRYLHLKRILDVVIVSLLLLVYSPVMLLAYLFLFLQGPREVFFMQDRIGANGNNFKMIKFRTMTSPDGTGRQRVTWVGKWLRKFRVDETPQLLNILKGDMSLIGPRPEIQYFVDRCRKILPYYDAVFSVRPGITGWAQVKFLHTTEMKDYPRKFCFNLYYLKNLSFSLDLLIVLKTIRVVLMGRGK